MSEGDYRQILNRWLLWLYIRINEQPAVDVSTYVVLILYPKTNSFRLTFTRVIEIEMPTHPPLAA